MLDYYSRITLLLICSFFANKLSFLLFFYLIVRERNLSRTVKCQFFGIDIYLFICMTLMLLPQLSFDILSLSSFS